MNDIPNLIQKLEYELKKNEISSETYSNYKVYRGLRDPLTNSGVLVGLTNLSSVTGSIIKDEERQPVEGELRYREIDIKDVIDKLSKNKFSFEIASFLILFGRWPTKEEEEEFLKLIIEYRELPEDFANMMNLKHPSSSVMNKLARSVLKLYSYDHNPDEFTISNNLRQSLMLISRFPTLIAYAYIALAHHFNNQSFYIHHPKRGLSIAEHFLHMIRPDCKFTAEEARILNVCLILHAEHGGGNNSTFTVRVVTSSGSDIYSSISAGIGSLKGPLHGGANKSVIEMMDDMMNNIPKDKWNNKNDVGEYVAKIFRKEVGDRTGLLYGFGHAIYTISDPRALILEKYAHKLAKIKNMEQEFELYKSVKETASDMFLKVTGKAKIISPNIDFFSGFIYKALGIPEEVYTPIFAMARISGWCAHRIEEMINGKRIIRPAYKYVKNK
jgi:citrate synthase